MQRGDTDVLLLWVLSTLSNGEIVSWKPDPLSFQQCVRITRPGGVICLTEAEKGISTSSACEHISALCARAMQRAGHSFSPEGHLLGITPMLGHFLREAGSQHMQ